MPPYLRLRSLASALAARHVRSVAVLVAASCLSLGAAGGPSVWAANAASDGPSPKALQRAGTTINVTTTNQEVNADANCSLQEAIYAANFDANKAINPSNLNGPKITTGCTAGSGADTIVLPANGVFTINGAVDGLPSGVPFHIVQNQFSVAGLSATPDITSTITIQGNGARLEFVPGAFSAPNIRAFVVNQQVGTE
ncbi:MAG: CSLREA domain-containing protein, partial [Anaerolineae bacterium]